MEMIGITLLSNLFCSCYSLTRRSYEKFCLEFTVASADEQHFVLPIRYFSFVSPFRFYSKESVVLQVAEPGTLTELMSVMNFFF